MARRHQEDMPFREERKPGMKLHVFLEITGECEGRCPWCPATAPGNGPVPLSRLEFFLQSLADHVEAFHLTGGEPLSHPRLPDVLRMVHGAGKPYTILTSGSEDISARCLEVLAQDPLFRGFSFSIHGGDFNGHLAFTGSLGVAKALAAMKGVSEHEIPCRASAVLGGHNRDTVRSLVRAVFAHGARQLIFTRYVGPYARGISIPGHETAALLAYIREIGQKGIPVDFSPCMPACALPGTAPCPGGAAMAVVGVDGVVRPCALTEYELGSLDASSFEELWSSARAETWRRGLSTRCTGCSLFAACGGGCRVFCHDFGLPGDPLALLSGCRA